VNIDDNPLKTTKKEHTHKGLPRSFFVDYSSQSTGPGSNW